MADDDPVPKIPYARGIRLSRPEMFRIAMFGALLVAVVVLAKPCSDSVSKFVTSFDSGSGSAKAGSGSAGSAGSAAPEPHYEHIGSNLTLEQYQELVKRSGSGGGSN